MQLLGIIHFRAGKRTAKPAKQTECPPADWFCTGFARLAEDLRQRPGPGEPSPPRAGLGRQNAGPRRPSAFGDEIRQGALQGASYFLMLTSSYMMCRKGCSWPLGRMKPVGTGSGMGPSGVTITGGRIRCMWMRLLSASPLKTSW